MRNRRVLRVLGVVVMAALGASGCSSETTVVMDESVVADLVATVVEDALPSPSAVEEPDASLSESGESGESGVSGGAATESVQERSADAVDDVFEEYRSSLLELDGERASRVVNQDTFAYYDRILDAGLHATADEMLSTIPLSDALGVLAMRARLGASLQDVPDGATLFAIGVERGLVGDSVATLQVDRFEVDGGQAFALVGGQRAMRFEYNEGAWYLDLPFTTSFIDDNEDEFIRGLTGGGTDRAALFDLVALGYGTTWTELSTPVG